MLQTEFESRTGVKVSYDEFKYIAMFYNTVECDKDEFCKMWCKMNPMRVMEAKAAAKAAKKKNELTEKVFNIYQKHLAKTKDCYYYGKQAMLCLTENEKQVLDQAGIKYKFDDMYSMTMCSVINSMLKYVSKH